MIGTDQIIAIASPVLSLLYPGAMTLLALSFLKEKISNTNKLTKLLFKYGFIFSYSVIQSV